MFDVAALRTEAGVMFSGYSPRSVCRARPIGRASASPAALKVCGADPRG